MPDRWDEQDDDGDVEWRRPWGLYAVGALILAVIVAGALVKLSGGDRSPGAAATSSAGGAAHSTLGTAPTPPATSGERTPTRSVPPGTVRPLPSPTATTHRAARPFVPGIPEYWSFVALSRTPGSESGTLAIVSPGSGTTVTMPVPPLQTGGPVSLVPGADRVLIHPLDREPAYVFEHEGLATTYYQGLLGSGGVALPGPESGQVWIQDPGDDAQFHLMHLDGRRTDISVRRPSDPSWVLTATDGAGYLLVQDSTGAYDVRPDTRRRVTKGTVVAVGPRTWLTRTCRAAHGCRLTVTDTTSHTRRTVPSPCPVRPAPAPSGRISPDGRTAALVCGSTHDARVLYLLDLRGGTGTAVHVDAPDDPASMVWAPRSRWLFIVDEHGDLEAIDRRGRDTKTIATGLPPLAQVAAAPTSGDSDR